MIRVLLADDQALLRGAFRLLLSREPDVEVVGEAADGNEAINQAPVLRPDVVLMDIRMPHLDGLEATRAIARDPDLAATRVLILTTFEVDEYVLKRFVPEQAASSSRNASRPNFCRRCVLSRAVKRCSRRASHEG